LEAWFDEQSRQVVRHPIAVPALKKIDCRPAKKTRDPLLAALSSELERGNIRDDNSKLRGAIPTDNLRKEKSSAIDSKQLSKSENTNAKMNLKDTRPRPAYNFWKPPRSLATTEELTAGRGQE
jgi:hypothetical protein